VEARQAVFDVHTLEGQLAQATTNQRAIAPLIGGANQQKGCTHDANGPRDARALEIIESLIARRLARYSTLESND
jgi:hypothetical protein